MRRGGAHSTKIARADRYGVRVTLTVLLDEAMLTVTRLEQFFRFVDRVRDLGFCQVSLEVIRT